MTGLVSNFMGVGCGAGYQIDASGSLFTVPAGFTTAGQLAPLCLSQYATASTDLRWSAILMTVRTTVAGRMHLAHCCRSSVTACQRVKLAARRRTGRGVSDFVMANKFQRLVEASGLEPESTGVARSLARLAASVVRPWRLPCEPAGLLPRQAWTNHAALPWVKSEYQRRCSTTPSSENSSRAGIASHSALK